MMGAAEIDALVLAYKSWISDLKSERAGVPAVSGDMTETAEGLIKRCEECLERIEDGIRFLQELYKILRF